MICIAFTFNVSRMLQLRSDNKQCNIYKDDIFLAKSFQDWLGDYGGLKTCGLFKHLKEFVEECIYIYNIYVSRLTILSLAVK